MCFASTAFLAPLLAVWLYNYSSFLFVGGYRLFFQVARRRIRCMILGGVQRTLNAAIERIKKIMEKTTEATV